MPDPDLTLLATVAKTWSWKWGHTEAEIRRAHDLTPTEFWRTVNQLVDTEAWMAADPWHTKALQRRRNQSPTMRRRRGVSAVGCR